MLSAGVELAQRGELGRHVAISTQRVLIGFGIGAVLGLVLGALIGLSAPARLIAAPTIGALRAVPSLAWVPLLLLWIGIGENSKVTLVAIGAFFPVYTTVSAALAHVDPKLVEAARAFGLRVCACSPRFSFPRFCRRSFRVCVWRWLRRGCSWLPLSCWVHPWVWVTC